MTIPRRGKTVLYGPLYYYLNYGTQWNCCKLWVNLGCRHCNLKDILEKASPRVYPHQEAANWGFNCPCPVFISQRIVSKNIQWIFTIFPGYINHGRIYNWIGFEYNLVITCLGNVFKVYTLAGVPPAMTHYFSYSTFETLFLIRLLALILVKWKMGHF